MQILTHTRCIGLWVSLLTVSAPGVAAEALAPSVTAFVHVAVVPMDRERVLTDMTVVVRGDRIEMMGPAATTAVARDTTVIDGRGKYVMPGLADMHAHTWEQEDFPLLLANGVTTVRNMYGRPLHLHWRERIARGELAAPNIYTAGPIIDGDPPIWPGSAVVVNAEQAQRAVAEQREAGYDFLKVYSRLSRRAYDALMAAARAHDMPVSGHVPEAVDLAAALRSGIKSIEHLSGYEYLAREAAGPGEEAVWARLEESKFATVARETARGGVWNCPTLVLFQHRIAPQESDLLRRWLDRPEMKYLSPEIVRSWYPANNFLKNTTPARAASSREKGHVLRKKLVKALHDAGARLLAGTDYGNPFVVAGFSLHQELHNFVDAGLSPYAALRTSTSGASQFLHAEAEFGTVTVGARADLLLLEANPLSDISNANKSVGVMVRGKWYPRADLTAALDAVAKKFATAGN